MATKILQPPPTYLIMVPKIDKLGIDKFAPVPTDLRKLSGVVKNEVVKKTEHEELVKKFKAIDTSGFVKKQIKDIKDKIPNITNLMLLILITALNATVNEVKNDIPDINTLVKKTDDDAEISEMEIGFYYF